MNIKRKAVPDALPTPFNVSNDILGVFAGNADRVEEELAEIKEEQAAKNEQIGNKGQKNAS